MPWRVVCPPDRYQQLRSDPAFQTLMMAGKIANALRFALSVVIDEHPEGMGNTSARARAGSFLYVSGVVMETLDFLPRLGKYYRDSKPFREILVPVQRDPGVIALRRGALYRLRNQSVFHNDEEVMAKALPTVALDEYVLVAGDTTLAKDIYYPLADIALIHHAVDAEARGEHIFQEMSVLLSDVARVSRVICNGFDLLIRDALVGFGCSYHDE